MAPRPVTLTFAGDATTLTRTFDKVGGGAKEMAADLDAASAKTRSLGGALDTTATKSGAAEGKFTGMADVLDGLGGAFGLPTEGATGLVRGFADLSGGLEPVLGMVKTGAGALATFATKLGITSAATAVWTGIQTAFNVVMAMNPIGLIVIAVAALAAALVVAYQNSETFRDVVNGAFDLVKRGVGESLGFILGRIGDLIGAAATVAEKIPGMGGVADKLREAQDKIDGMAASVKTFGDNTDAAAGRVGHFTGTLEHLNRVPVNQGLLAVAGAGAAYGGGTVGGVKFMQHGGHLAAGQAAIIGEAGPELFIPGRSGTVVPGGVGGTTVVVNLNASIIDPDAAARIGALLREEIRRSGPLGLA